MRRSIPIIAFIITICIMSSCVTKQKYLELDAKCKEYEKSLNFSNSEKLTYEGKAKELGVEVGQLKEDVAKLKKDTLSLSRKLNDSERNLTKMKMDYDELMKSFSTLNQNSNNELGKMMANIDSIKNILILKESELNEKELRLSELENILKQKDEEVQLLKLKVSEALKGFVDKGLNISERNGKVYVSMDEKLLFASGSWEIGKQGLEAIKELGKILEADTTINVVIEGHTDNVPYKGSSAVKDNWDLSVMRATAVVKNLLKDTNINPQRISASGRGEYLPVVENDTPESKAKNRRTEIILTPKLDELFQLIESN